MAETWPVGVPSKPKVGSQQAMPFRKPLATDFEDGNLRQRRSTTKNVATLAFPIEMSAAQFVDFKTWVRDVLVDGTLPFTMSIWTGSAYATRTCSFVQPYSESQLGGADHTVTVNLDVEDW